MRTQARLMVEITASGAGRQEPSASLAGEASDVSAPEGGSLECQKRRYGRASAEPAHVRFERAKHNPEFTPYRSSQGGERSADAGRRRHGRHGLLVDFFPRLVARYDAGSTANIHRCSRRYSRCCEVGTRRSVASGLSNCFAAAESPRPVMKRSEGRRTGTLRQPAVISSGRPCAVSSRALPCR